MPETVFGKVEEFAPAELMNTAVGVGMGAIGHMILESALDKFLQPKYPTNYMFYSTGISCAVFLVTAFVLYIYGRRPGYEFFQYIAGGLFLAELVQLLDMIRVEFTFRGE
ncbi:MAG: hypothetical protein QXV75_08450 [Candidatus Bathyarchaeia archaeon]